jgi:hypothetical protein
MGVINKTCFLVSLVVMTLFIQNAGAGTTLILPDSSYMDGAWQGYTIYDEGGFNVLVDFAVYDSENLELPGETAFVNELGAMSGQYIYAYQVFNHLDATEDVGYFEIRDVDGNSIDQSLMADTGSLDDGEGGIEPLDPSPWQGVWLFTEGAGGIIIPFTHSYFLVLSSDSTPVAGSFEIKGPSGEPPVPDVPEPTTITLLGLGGIFLFAGRRQAVQKIKVHN